MKCLPPSTSRVSSASVHAARRLWVGLMTVVLIGPTAGLAQNYVVKPGPNQPRRPSAVPTNTKTADDSKTLLSVELVAGKEGVGYQAQLWRPVFEQMGVDVRIRPGNSTDKPEVKEEKVGTFRHVTVIGALDRQGRIILPDRTFSRDDAAKLTTYLQELKTFGNQGNPTGQPLWGLNEEQFSNFYKTFSEKVADDVKGLSLAKAIETLNVPERFRVRLTKDAEAWLRTEFPGQPVFRQTVTGFSRGTAFAMLLNDYGLGFKPIRTPAGQVEIAIEPLQNTTKVWPVGWQLKDSQQRTAPSLFELVPVELEDAALVDVLNAVSVKTKIPIRFDYYRIEANNLDVTKTLVSYPPRKTSWSLLLRGVTNPNRLSHDLKIDELGQPFVWITTLKLGKLGR